MIPCRKIWGVVSLYILRHASAKGTKFKNIWCSRCKSSGPTSANLAAITILEVSIDGLLLVALPSNHCPAGMQSAIFPPCDEPNSSHDASDEPQEQADKVYPDGILHPLHP